jgi:hypothetical protein
MRTINSHFIGNFKDGDNICYNLEVLNKLYEAYYRDEERSPFLRKPITVFIVAILEAALDDLFYKIRGYTREGVPNLSADTVAKVRTNTSSYRKFKTQIKCAKNHDFFDVAGSNFYTVLDELRKIRNRMHIQNNYRDTPFGENEVFTERRLIQAEKVCEHTLAKMSEKFPRSPYNRGYVDDFILPWNSHYS